MLKRGDATRRFHQRRESIHWAKSRAALPSALFGVDIYIFSTARRETRLNLCCLNVKNNKYRGLCADYEFWDDLTSDLLTLLRLRQLRRRGKKNILSFGK